MLSAKTENYVVSIAKKTDVNVIDDKAAIAWIKRQKLDPKLLCWPQEDRV